MEEIMRDISNHFNQEITLRKEILEEEKKIANYQLETSQAENEIYMMNLSSNPTIKMKEAKAKIVKCGEDIEACQKKLNEKYVTQSSLIKKRVLLQKLIKQYSCLPGGSSLNATYQYFLVLLDNLTLQHRNYINGMVLQGKKLSVDRLEDQIKIRDQALFDLGSKLKNKKKFLEINKSIQTLQEMDLDPLIELPVLKANNPVFHENQLRSNSSKHREVKSSKELPYYQPKAKNKQNPSTDIRQDHITMSCSLIHTLTKSEKIQID
jgi:hypothetical protein